MKKLIGQLTLFVIALGLGYCLLYLALDRYYNPPLKASDNNVFIWGDSQMFQGLNLKLYAEKTGKTVYSAARHGAGVYDFLVFTERVPENAEVMLSISKLVQIRRKEKDNNMSGVSIEALKQLFQYNYSILELRGIVTKNKKPQNFFSTENNTLFTQRDVAITGLLNRFKNYFDKKPNFLDQKQAILEQGLINLKNKGCKVFYINFPFHRDLKNLENSSPIKPITDSFYQNIYSGLHIDTLSLHDSINLMYDLTHMNSKGANLVTEYLAEKIQKEGFSGVLNIQLTDSM